MIHCRIIYICFLWYLAFPFRLLLIIRFAVVYVYVDNFSYFPDSFHDVILVFNLSTSSFGCSFLYHFPKTFHSQSSLIHHLPFSSSPPFFSSFTSYKAPSLPLSSLMRRPAEPFETFLQIKQVRNFEPLPPSVNEIFSERHCVSPTDTQNAAAPCPVQHPRGGPQKLDAGRSDMGGGWWGGCARRKKKWIGDKR